MKRFQSNPILFTVFLFISLMFSGILIGSFIVRDRLDHIVYGNRFYQIDGEYESEIISDKDNLGTINIHMKNPALGNTGSVVFELFENDTPIRHVDFTGKNIADPGDVKLKFDPIANSAGKSYLAKLTIEQKEPKLSVFVDDNNKLGGWYYFRNASGLSGLGNTISAVSGKVTADKVFMVLWSVSLVTVSILYSRSKN